MKSLARPSLLPEIAEYLVDERVGIIRGVMEIPREAGAPAFFHFYAEASSTSAFTKQRNFKSAGGASVDRGIGLSKAIGEAVERYCSAIYDRNELLLSSFKNASFPCVSPESFTLYSREQYVQKDFLYFPFEESTPVRWTRATDPLTGQLYGVPAGMVFIPYEYDQQAVELPIVQPISTGLACHETPEQAAISAICEVIERDAFTITWQAGLSMPKLNFHSLSETNRDLIRRFDHCGATVTLLNITMDHGVPTILAVLRSSSSESPAMVVAAAADMDPEQAIRKSLEELAHTRRLAQQFRSELPAFVATAEFKNVAHQDDHVHLYCDRQYARLADFLLSSKRVVDFNEIENLSVRDAERGLEILLAKIKGISHTALIANLTTPDVRELGLSVVRAIIPGFHPLFMGHMNRALGGSRLWEVPQKMGYEGITREAGDNDAPHPYP